MLLLLALFPRECLSSEEAMLQRAQAGCAFGASIVIELD